MILGMRSAPLGVAMPSPAVSQSFLTDLSTPAWLDVSGIAGNRTMFDSTGKLTYAPNNMMLQSDAFATTPWTVVTLSYNTGTNLATSSSTAAYARQTVSLLAGYNYIFAVDVKPGTIGWVYLFFQRGDGTTGTAYFNAATGAVGTTTNVEATGSAAGANGFVRVWIKINCKTTIASAIAQTSLASADGSVTIANGNTLYIKAAQVEAVTYETTARPYIATTTAAYYGPRFDYGLDNVARGLLVEEARTNVSWLNRDMTSAQWTKTSVTAAKDQAGIDGLANSASSLTATAGNGTCLQPRTLASSQRCASAYVKRITGTGTIQMTTDGGTTWTTIAVTGSWARYSIPAQTVVNPSTGFRIVTNGDAIAVDFVQNENGAFATSPILVGTTASITRSADTVIKFAGTALSTLQGAAGTMLQEINLLGNDGVDQYGVYGGGVSPVYFDSSLGVKATNGTNVLAASQTAVAGTPGRGGLAWDVDGRAISWSGSAAVTDANGFGTIGSTVYVGSNNGSNNINGWVRSLSFYSSKLTGAQLAIKTVVGASL